MKSILTILKGMTIGIANVIPGVSGGTMAFITGIYEDLMEALGQFFKNKEKRKQYFILLLLVVVGAGAGILLFSHLLKYLLEKQAQLTYLFFLGLIAGSIPVIIKAHHDMKIKPMRILALVLGFAMVAGLILLTGEKTDSHREAQVLSQVLGFVKITAIEWKYALWLIVCGLLGAVSMIIPGFSGSALLVTLGEYSNIIYFIDEFMIVPIIFVGIGAVLGILLFARLIDWALKKHTAVSFYFILGLIFGSFVQIVVEILPGFNTSWLYLILSLVSVTAGFFLAFFLGKINPEKSGAKN